jgi:hypothetical protein
MKVDLSMLDLNKTKINIHEMNNADIKRNRPSYILKVEINGRFTTSMTDAAIPPSSLFSIPFVPQDYRYDAMNYFLTR